jgi:hypothetical protein
VSKQRYFIHRSGAITSEHTWFHTFEAASFGMEQGDKVYVVDVIEVHEATVVPKVVTITKRLPNVNPRRSK